VIRQSEIKGVAMSALKILTDMGVFIGQSPAFFAFMQELAEEADKARHGMR